MLNILEAKRKGLDVEIDDGWLRVYIMESS